MMCDAFLEDLFKEWTHLPNFNPAAVSVEDEPIHMMKECLEGMQVILN